jgi:hypothetical protein
MHTLTGHSGIVASVAFSPDERILDSASEDGTVKLRDVARGAEITTSGGFKATIPGRTSSGGQQYRSQDQALGLEGRRPHCHFRPAQASLALRPAGSLSRLKRPLSRGSSPSGCSAKPPVGQFPGSDLPPLMIRAFDAHCKETFNISGLILQLSAEARSKPSWGRALKLKNCSPARDKNFICQIPDPSG